MPRPKRWAVTAIDNGYGEVRLYKWRYFLEYIHQRMLDYETYIWRGHRCDSWSLEPTLDRLMKKARVPSAKRRSFRMAHLEKFKYATRGRRGTNPPSVESENDWWALGQHHGLSTPLLDWTTSPFVAAYFAFVETGGDQTRQRAVFALHRPSVERKSREIQTAMIERQQQRQKDKEEAAKKAGVNVMVKTMLEKAHLPEIRAPVEFVRPMSDENQRLVSQGGLFTRAPDGMTLEEWTKQNFPDENLYVLMKIFIPNKDREDCLKTLNRMNINHLALFPDLYGASKYCNLFGEIEKY